MEIFRSDPEHITLGLNFAGTNYYCGNTGQFPISCAASSTPGTLMLNCAEQEPGRTIICNNTFTANVTREGNNLLLNTNTWPNFQGAGLVLTNVPDAPKYGCSQKEEGNPVTCVPGNNFEIGWYCQKEGSHLLCNLSNQFNYNQSSNTLMINNYNNVKNYAETIPLAPLAPNKYWIIFWIWVGIIIVTLIVIVLINKYNRKPFRR